MDIMIIKAIKSWIYKMRLRGPVIKIVPLSSSGAFLLKPRISKSSSPALPGSPGWRAVTVTWLTGFVGISWDCIPSDEPPRGRLS